MNLDVNNPITRIAILQAERLRPLVAAQDFNKQEYKTLPTKVELELTQLLNTRAVKRETDFDELCAYRSLGGTVLLNAVREMSRESEILASTSDRAGALAWAMTVYLLLRYCSAHHTVVPPEVINAFAVCLKLRLKEYMENLP